jgi:two-component system chemotaxis response regulator CheB
MASADIRVLIAEDSPTVRRHLTGMINETPGMHVVGEARDGEEAIILALELKPDVISMDIRMPLLDGLEATRRIMSRQPTPVVVVSGLLERDVDLSFQALQAGALAVVEKPPDRKDPAFAAKHRQLVTTLAAMARVGVVRRWENDPGRNALTQEMPRPRISTDRLRIAPEVIAIGASAGGPGALSAIFRDLPADFPVPIVVVQHMPDEFVAGLARWLHKATPLQVVVAADNLVLEPGVVHLGPGSAHLTVARQPDGRLAARLLKARGPYRYQPSVDVLFESIAQVCGRGGVGLILTGMGDDGAAGLLAMRQTGAVTLAQDEASCTVYGMPGAAVARGAVEHELALSNLATTLLNLI